MNFLFVHCRRAFKKTEIIKSFISEKFSILLERCHFSAFIQYFMGSFVSTAAFIIIIIW